MLLNDEYDLDDGLLQPVRGTLPELSTLNERYGDAPFRFELPHFVYAARLSDIAIGRAIQAAIPVAFRVIIALENEPVAAAYLAPTGAPSELLGVNYGPQVRSTWSAWLRAREFDGSYEARLLDLPELAQAFLWLHDEARSDSDSGSDILLRLDDPHTTPVDPESLIGPAIQALERDRENLP